MKEKIFVGVMLIVLVLLIFIAASHETGASSVRPRFLTAPDHNYRPYLKTSDRLNHTAAITFTPAITFYLPVILKQWEIYGLSPADQATVIHHLQILSGGWVQHSVDTCNTIFLKPAYEAEDWAAFFTAYFKTHPFTYALWDYLGYPVFWWFGDDVHLKLQEGLIVAMRVKIEDTMTRHGPDLSDALAADPNLRQTFVMAHRFMNAVANDGVVGEARKQELYDFFIDQVETWPQYWKKSAAINPVSQPYIAALAAQIQANLRDLLPLTPARKAHLAAALELQGTYLALWNDFSLLIFDNNGLDQAQLTFIYNYLAAIPAPLLHLKNISVYDFLGNSGETALPLTLDGVNVFGVKIGAALENPFPADVAPKYCDGFVAVVAHEVNHRVDGEYVQKQPAFQNRRAELVAQAGDYHLNYLRSMLPDGFFTDAPQEFFASIANQWFCDSAQTVRLGLARFANGYHKPLNQALFFADVYSAGSNFSKFYIIDQAAAITTTFAALGRDGNGHINAITLPEGTYYFTLDHKGNVVSVSGPQ